MFGNDKKDPYDYQGQRKASGNSCSTKSFLQERECSLLAIHFSDIVDGALSAARKAAKVGGGISHNLPYCPTSTNS